MEEPMKHIDWNWWWKRVFWILPFHVSMGVNCRLDPLGEHVPSGSWIAANNMFVPTTSGCEEMFFFTINNQFANTNFTKILFTKDQKKKGE